MKTSSQLLMLGMLWPLAAAAADGPEAPPADTAQWKCESCPFEKSGIAASVEAGVGHVSKDSAKFSEYDGVDRKGAYFIGDGEAVVRGTDGTTLRAAAANLGLRSRSVGLESGKQGQYGVSATYDELLHRISDTVQTPFLGTGGNTLTLPAGFPAATTALMPLATTLQPIDLETERKRVGAGAYWLPDSGGWEYAVNFRNEQKTGTKRTAGAFFVNTAQLVEPVDYITNQLDASASYTGARWQAKLAYYGSSFRNRNDGLSWTNPFALGAAFPGATAGQLAAPPDNQFHQLLASIGYQYSARTRLAADLAYGRATQDESFLAPTANAILAAALPALPRSSLDGRADYFNANVKMTSALSDRLKLNALYSRNERDNKTPQAVYSWVSTDMFAGTPRSNLPYSFDQDKVRLAADYRATQLVRGSVGYDFDRTRRTFQEAERTRENAVWAKIAARFADKVDVSAKLAHGERDNSGYQPVAQITPPENPLLRKFNMADRKRDSGEVRADIAATESISIGLGLTASRDDYSDSPIGLTRGMEVGLNADVVWRASERITLHAFANRDRIRSRQAGSQTFATADWTGRSDDTIEFFGVGVRHAAIKDKLDIGADYGLLRAKSDINVETGLPSGFPTISSARDSLRLFATYRIKDTMSVNASFLRERYDTDNWMLEGVAPNTIPNVLAFGEEPPRYSVNVLTLSLRHKF